MKINSSNIMAAIKNAENWKRTHKKKYELYMCVPQLGTKVINKLEGTQYITDKNKPFVLSGTIGETWVIDGNKLAKSYMFADGKPIMMDFIKEKCGDADNNGLADWTKIVTKPDSTNVWAFLLPKEITNFPVKTSWGDVLLANRPGIGHGKGDFIVCSDNDGQPNLNDAWVVNGSVFIRTYDMHAFPGVLADDEIVEACTICPNQKYKSIVVKQKSDKIIAAIAKGLEAKGHRIGAIRVGEVLNKSFKIDNGAYGILLQNTEDNPNYNGISVFAYTKNGFEEVLFFLFDQEGLDGTISRIHELTTGSKANDEIENRAIKSSENNHGNEIYALGTDTYSAKADVWSTRVQKILNILSKKGFKVISESRYDKGESKKIIISIKRTPNTPYAVLETTFYANGKKESYIKYCDANGKEVSTGFVKTVPGIDEKDNWKKVITHIYKYLMSTSNRQAVNQ